MADLDIELDSGLIEGIKGLARRYYGDDGDSAVSRVAEAALEMRLLWLKYSGEGGTDIEEPVVTWEFGDPEGAKQLPEKIGELLFKRR